MKQLPIRFLLKDAHTKRLVLVCGIMILIGFGLAGIQLGCRCGLIYFHQLKVSKIALPDLEVQKRLDIQASIAKLEASFEFKPIEELIPTPSEYFLQKDSWTCQASIILAEAGIIDNTDHFWGMKAYKAYNSNLSNHEWSVYYRHRTALTWLLYACALNPPESIQSLGLNVEGYVLEIIASESVLRKWVSNILQNKVPICIQKIDCKAEYSEIAQNIPIQYSDIRRSNRYKYRIVFQLNSEIAQFEQLMKRFVCGLNSDYEAMLKCELKSRIVGSSIAEVSTEPLYKLKGYYRLSEAADSLQFLIYSVRHKQFLTIGIGECSELYQVCPLSFEPPHAAKDGIAATPAQLKLHIIDLDTIIELEL